MSLEKVIYEAVADALNKQLEPLLQPLLTKLNVSDYRLEDDLLTRPEAASLLKVSPITMSIWAHEKRGPEYVRLGSGRGVRYKRSALTAFLDSNKGLIGRKGRPPKATSVVTSGKVTS
jgi:predicted DNA-binding transcriptional regulator AlpA